MITLNKNYKVKTDSTHGFVLQFESDEYEKTVIIKKKKVLKTLTNKESYYYPKLSMCLEKFFKLMLVDIDSVQLLDTLNSIEKTISRFDKTFSNNGNILKL